MSTEYETVFVKDMAYYLVDRLDSAEYIPENYTHAFLLRDPHKSVYSLYKMSLNKELTGRMQSHFLNPRPIYEHICPLGLF